MINLFWNGSLGIEYVTSGSKGFRGSIRQRGDGHYLIRYVSNIPDFISKLDSLSLPVLVALSQCLPGFMI
jgi:hypothetical protein